MNKRDNNTLIIIIILMFLVYFILDHFFHNTINSFKDIILVVLLSLLYIFSIVLIIRFNLHNKIDKKVILCKRKRTINNIAITSALIIIPLIIINIFLLDKKVNTIFPIILFASLIATIIPFFILYYKFFKVDKNNIKYIHEYEEYLLEETKKYFKKENYPIKIIYLNNEEEISKPNKITDNYRSFIQIKNKKIIAIWISNSFIKYLYINRNDLKIHLKHLFEE